MPTGTTQLLPIHLILDELDWDSRKALPVALELGFSDFGLRMFNQQRYPDVNDEDQRWLEDLHDRKICRFDVISPGTNKDRFEAGAAERFLREAMPLCLERARRLGVPEISLFSWAKADDALQPAPGANLSPSMPFDAIAACLRRAAELTAAVGITLTIEVGYQCWCDTGLGAAELLRAINHPAVRMLWDPVNSLSGRVWWQQRRAQPALITQPMEILRAELEQIAPLIAGVHVRDVVLEPTAWRYVLLGEGVVNWPELIAELLQKGYRGALTVEHHIQAPRKEEATRHSLEYLKQQLARLA